MNIARFYYKAAIVVAVLEIIDGTLLLINRGLISWFNVMVSLIELNWLPVCVLFVFYFKNRKRGLMSPLSYVIYNTAGFLIASNNNSSTNDAVGGIPLWIGIMGVVFGFYYLILNDMLRQSVTGSEVGE